MIVQVSTPARVLVDIGPFRFLEIYELDGEFLGFYRDEKERYLLVTANTATGRASVANLLRMGRGAADDEGEPEPNLDAMLALTIAFAATLRDFVVVEERTTSFRTRVARQRSCPTNSDLSVIYLPRVRYLRPDAGALRALEHDGSQRAAHDVTPHLRRAEKPSPAQTLLALRYNFSVPRGYTFVRPHRRGDTSMEERKRVYRSRSATAVLYHVVQNVPTGKPVAWFQFERDVANALTRLGLRVEHQAASRNGDSGIDVYAYGEADDVVWPIQCKCYRSRYLGRSSPVKRTRQLTPM